MGLVAAAEEEGDEEVTHAPGTVKRTEEAEEDSKVPAVPAILVMLEPASEGDGTMLPSASSGPAPVTAADTEG